MKNKIGLFILLAFLAGACSERKVETDVPGCTDPSSLNYNKDATIDDGTCLMPSKVQYGFVIEYTASWCTYCGSDGAPKMHELYKSGRTVGIAAHAGNGDPMNNSALYGSFNSCRPDGGGIPHFWVGDVDAGETSDLTTLKAREPDASVVCVGEVVGEKMEIKTISQFFKDLQGDYFLSVYVMESGIDGYSAGPAKQVGTTDPMYMHDLVLRTANTPSFAYGEQIIDKSVQKDATVSKSYSIDLDPSWNKDNVYAVACIWKKNPDSGFYEFVNGFDTGTHLSH